MTFVSTLGTLHRVSQQLADDIPNSSHKYIAHQMAILYRCVDSTIAVAKQYYGRQHELEEMKKEIEGKFMEVKTSIEKKTSAGEVPRLSLVQEGWMKGITARLCELLPKVQSNFVSQHRRFEAFKTMTVNSDVSY